MLSRAAWCVRGIIFPGPIRSSRELTLIRIVVFFTRHPPTFVGTQGIISPRRPGGSANSFIAAGLPWPASACAPQNTFMESSQTLVDEKAALRAKARERREKISPAQREAAATALAESALSFLDLSAAKIISGYYPSRDEVDCLPLLDAVEKNGHSVALPFIQAKNEPLIFRAWKSGAPLEPGTFKIPVPPPSSPEVEPDIFLVPLLAFDRAGYRLGYGGGFYDRTLAQVRAKRDVVAIGIAFDEQEMSGVPHAPYDEPLDWLLTPSGPIACKG